MIFFFFASGKPFSNTDVICYAASNIISGIMFGKRFEYSDPIFQGMVERDHESIRLTGSASILVQQFCSYPDNTCTSFAYCANKILLLYYHFSLHGGPANCLDKRFPRTCATYLARILTRSNFSLILWIDLPYPSGREPIESVYKGKGKLGRCLGQPSLSVKLV